LNMGFYIFTNPSFPPPNIILHISPSLNQGRADRPLKYGIEVDGEIPQTATCPIRYALHTTLRYAF
jgi:hypothetical protein